MRWRAVVKIAVAVGLLLFNLAMWVGTSQGQVFHSYAVRCTTSGTVAAGVAPGRTMLLIRNDDENATILLYNANTPVHALTASDNSSQVGMFALHARANSNAAAHLTSQLVLEGPVAKIGFNCVSTGINSGVLRWIEFYAPGR